MICKIKYSTKEIVEIQKKKGIQLEILIDHVVTKLYECKSFTSMVLKYVTRNKGQEEDSSDIIQEALLALVLILKNNKFRGDASIENYTFSICKKLWLSKIKRSIFSKTIHLGIKVGPERVDNDNPESELETNEIKKKLWKKIDQLGPQCKELLRLMSLGFSHQEIAAKFNWERLKSRKQRSRCKLLLRNLIQNDKDFFS